MIENLLIIDTETTGLEPTKGSKLIEIGAVLYNIKHKIVLQSFASLFPCEENPVEDINKIPAVATRERMAVNSVNPHLIEMASCAQVCVAHNAEFDKKFLAQLGCGQILLEKKWVCTKKDFKWPVMLTRNRLQDICEALKVPYVNAHRALTDCFFLVECFNKVPFLDGLMQSATRNSFSNSARFR